VIKGGGFDSRPFRRVRMWWSNRCIDPGLNELIDLGLASHWSCIVARTYIQTKSFKWRWHDKHPTLALSPFSVLKYNIDKFWFPVSKLCCGSRWLYLSYFDKFLDKLGYTLLDYNCSPSRLAWSESRNELSPWLVSWWQHHKHCPMYYYDYYDYYDYYMLYYAVGLHTDVSEDGGRQWINTDKTTPRYLNWRSGSPCRRKTCNSVRARGRCVAVGARRQLVDRRCDAGRRRAVCSRPATAAPSSNRRRRRRPKMPSPATSWAPDTRRSCPEYIFTPPLA